MQPLYTNLKPKTPSELQSNLIYQVNCSQCNKIYIGQTKQLLKNRLNQHKLAISQHKKNNTALSNHALENFHTFDFKNTKIIHKENNISKRLFLEMCYIKNNDKTINYQTDIENLSVVYNDILKINNKTN